MTYTPRSLTALLFQVKLKTEIENCERNEFHLNHILKSLILAPTCSKNSETSSCKELILINFARSFQSCVVESGLPDFHKMIVTITKSSLQKVNGRALTLFRMGRGQKGSLYQFLPCNFYKRRNQPQHFLTFSFNPLTTRVQNFKFAPSASSKLLNLNQDHPLEKAGFLVKSL